MVGPTDGYLGIDCSFVDEEEKALDLKTLQKRGSHLKPSISQGRKPGVFLLVKKLGFKFFKPCLTIILRSDEATLTQLWQAPSVFESTILRRLSLPRHMHPATSLYSKLCLGGIANHRVKKKKIGRQTTHLLLLFCPFTRKSFDLLKPLWMKSLE